MRIVKYLPLGFVFLLSACVTIPHDAFLLSPVSLQERQLQTRVFETADEVALLAAGIGVLQDMGYSIDNTEKSLGLISASKQVDATDGKQIAGAIIIALLGGEPMPVDKEQKIKVNFITLPSRLNKKGFIARISFQRMIWDTQGQVRAETLKSPALYEEFFDKLSKSVFLEAHKI